ncbi:MAG: 2-isopropylmalate synthase [Myxococcales bacterium]
MSESTDRVVIFDTTLRDGEQAPGASMTLPQKLKVAAALQALNVDVIEAGFPAASPGDFESVRAVARRVRGVSICGLARAQREDISRAWDALREAEKPRIHVFLATSPIHREFKLRMTREQVVQNAVAAVKYAREQCPDVEFSPEDAARTEPEFLAEVVARVVEAGATTVNIPDTVGYAMPAQFAALIAMVRKTVGSRAVVSVHCHDDLGLATANSLAAVQEGARQIECTVNGIGERAGNCSLEEVVMAIRTRADFLRVHTRVNTEQICSASRAVSLATGFLVPRNKAVVGQNAFAHESGIHQHGMLKNVLTYEIMKPQDVGVRSTDLVLGKHSGRAALGERLEKLGYRLDASELDKVFAAFKDLADRKKEIYDGDLDALVETTTFGTNGGRWKLVSIHAVSGTNAAPSAAVCLEMKDGRRVEDAAVGDGPVDAVFKSIERITGVRAQLRDFRIVSMTPGEDAQGEVLIEVEHDGRRYGGRGVSTDIIVGSARAFLEVVNRISAGRPRAVRPVHDEEVACGAV